MNTRFDPEDGESMHVRNVSNATHTRISINHRESLKSLMNVRVPHSTRFETGCGRCNWNIPVLAFIAGTYRSRPMGHKVVVLVVAVDKSELDISVKMSRLLLLLLLLLLFYN
jgi:hypothetical protein